MSSEPTIGSCRVEPQSIFCVLGDEGFRIFFSLSALYAARFPLIWVLAFGFDLPLAQQIAAGTLARI